MTVIERPRERRYGWFRHYNGFVRHPKWKVVKRLAGVGLCEVHSVVAELLECANRAKPRGSVADFSVLECAAELEIEPDDVRRVYAVLEDVGWLDQEHIATWDERQPDHEDTTAKDRQKRRRERLKEERKHQARASRRDMRDVTPQTQTQISKKEAIETELGTGSIVTWAEVERAERPKQRALPLRFPPPIEVKQRGDR